jgi:hypothetical protein
MTNKMITLLVPAETDQVRDGGLAAGATMTTLLVPVETDQAQDVEVATGATKTSPLVLTETALVVADQVLHDEAEAWPAMTTPRVLVAMTIFRAEMITLLTLMGEDQNDLIGGLQTTMPDPQGLPTDVAVVVAAGMNISQARVEATTVPVATIGVPAVTISHPVPRTVGVRKASISGQRQRTQMLAHLVTVAGLVLLGPVAATRPGASLGLYPQPTNFLLRNALIA